MDDLKLIKKHYGEDMMHLCRMLFPTLLEKEGLLWEIISKKFAYSKFLYDDIVNNYMEEEFKGLIYGEVNVENNNELVVTKTPKELLSEAGYDLYECKTEEDIQEFRKYYYKSEKDKKYQFMTNYGVPSYIGEELCTFGGGRLNRCYVFFAVKKNVDEIKRENFKNPNRQDEYGTSVISIQFTRDDSNTLSIKNRYNHTVNYPDSTFSNNLDKIIFGLTEAFNKEYNLNIDSMNKHNFDLPGYIKANDGKFYKCNFEINNVYYCPNNIIIDYFTPYELDKSKYLVMENYILDLKNKKLYSSLNNLFKKNRDEIIKDFNELPAISNDDDYPDSDLKDKPIDSFIESIGEIKNIRIELDKKKKERSIIINDDIKIVLDKYNNIVEYYNKNTRSIYDNFLPHNTKMRKVDLPNVLVINDDFLPNNEFLEEINMPNVTKIHNSFLGSNDKLEYLDLPNVKEIYHDFLTQCSSLETINMPNVVKIHNYCFTHCVNIRKLDLPKVEEIGNNFLNNAELDELSLPNLRKIGMNSCTGNYRYPSSIKKLYLPNIRSIGKNSFSYNNLEELDMPNLQYLDDFNLNHYGDTIKKINFPKLMHYNEKVWDDPKYYNIKSANAEALIDLFNYCPNIEEINISDELKNEILDSIPYNIVEILNKNKSK